MQFALTRSSSALGRSTPPRRLSGASGVDASGTARSGGVAPAAGNAPEASRLELRHRTFPRAAPPMTESDEEPTGGDAGPAKQGRPAASPLTAGLEAEARQGREAAAGRADLAAPEGAEEALRRADAELAASRTALRER